MSRNNIHFESRLERVARIMSRNWNVDVVIEGNQAYTDGSKIILPMLEDVSDELFADLDAFLDHEIAHVKFTDFPEMRKPKRLINRFHKELFNAVEDSRIELLLPLEYPGTEMSLDRLNEKFGAKMQEGRAAMPWPIRLIICIREIFDGKTPKTDSQIEPIIAAILPQARALKAKCNNTSDVLTLTEELIKDINLAREKLSDGLEPLSEEEMKKAMEELDKMLNRKSPVELDPNRKDRDSKEARGEEQYDPATEMKDSDGDGEGEEGESDGEGEEGKQSNDAGMSAEQDGDEKASNGKKGKDGKDKKGEAELGESEKAKKGDASEEETDNRNKSLETHESTEGKEGKERKEKKSKVRPETPKPEFDGSHELETRKNYAQGWIESPKEAEMLTSPVEGKSEFDEHVFSSESYMEIQLEKAVDREPKVSRSHGYYYGQGDKINAKSVSLPYSREYDEIIDFTGRGSREEYAKRKRKVMRHINPIKNKLERVLKVKENAKTTPEKERGQLNTRTLATMCIDKNYRTPFKQFTKIDTTNVAVTLLIDCSGSMGGDKIEVARQTALALGEALKGIGINFEALGFNTSSSSALASKIRTLTEKEVQRFNRFGETLRLMVFKKFESSDLTGVVKAEAGGANADGESIIWAAKRLALRKEKRKILIVLSDGQPAYGGANHEILAGDLKRVIGLLPKSGIEPIGIGILTDDPKLFYPQWVEVSDVSKLSSTVMGKLSRMLQDGIK